MLICLFSFPPCEVTIFVFNNCQIRFADKNPPLNSADMHSNAMFLIVADALFCCSVLFMNALCLIHILQCNTKCPFLFCNHLVEKKSVFCINLILFLLS